MYLIVDCLGRTASSRNYGSYFVELDADLASPKEAFAAAEQNTFPAR